MADGAASDRAGHSWPGAARWSPGPAARKRQASGACLHTDRRSAFDDLPGHLAIRAAALKHAARGAAGTRWNGSFRWRRSRDAPSASPRPQRLGPHRARPCTTPRPRPPVCRLAQRSSLRGRTVRACARPRARGLRGRASPRSCTPRPTGSTRSEPRPQAIHLSLGVPDLDCRAAVGHPGNDPGELLRRALMRMAEVAALSCERVRWLLIGCATDTGSGCVDLRFAQTQRIADHRC